MQNAWAQQIHMKLLSHAFCVKVSVVLFVGCVTLGQRWASVPVPDRRGSFHSEVCFCLFRPSLHSVFHEHDNISSTTMRMELWNQIKWYLSSIMYEFCFHPEVTAVDMNINIQLLANSFVWNHLLVRSFGFLLIFWKKMERHCKTVYS